MKHSILLRRAKGWRQAAKAAAQIYEVRHSGTFSCLITIALIFLNAHPALAAVRTVTSLDDNASGSLRDIISIAAVGDTINFAVTGTILLTTGPLNNLGKNLTIDNASGPNTLKVERSSAAGSFRIFQIEGGTVIITGLAMSQGRANLCSGGSDACSGGGIFIGTSTTLTLNNCVIAGNEAFYGGGIGNFGTLTLSDCTIENNSASGGTQSSHGGGIMNRGTLTASHCTINNNNGKPAGGAVVNDGTLTLVNCTLFDNHAATGGAIYNSASASIMSCTISRNGSFSIPGGRVYNNNGSLTLRNTILDSTGPGAYNPNLGVNRGNITSQGYNLSTDDGSGLLTGPGDQINVDPSLDPYGLVYSAGYTKTIALTPGSPAIDKGQSFGLASDQRGQPRPVDNPLVASAPGGDGSDIGAYESPSDPIQSATTLIVTTANDHDDGICGGLDCTLREAIQRANTLPGLNTIILDGSLPPTIALQTRTLGELVVSDSTSIVGPGARVLALSSDGYNRVFTFLGGASTISGLTIRDGITAAGSGTGGMALGGGIYNQATLMINDCTITENRALGGSGGAPSAPGGTGAGGGIFNVGTLTLNRCAFIHNQAFGGSGAANLNQLGSGGDGGRAQGSAIFCAGTATLVNNCTFFNNVVNGGTAGQGARFGGNGGNAEGTIFNESLLTVTASTLSGNHGIGGTRGLGNSEVNHGVYGAGRAGLYTSAGNTAVRNTISASNIVLGFAVSVDVHGAYLSEGFNVIGSADNSTGFTQPTDQTGTYDFPLDPMLGPLQNHGGPTDTMAVRYGSPAFDRGHSFSVPTDQRGSPRPVDTAFANAAGGDGTDIGAFEVNVFAGPDSDGDGMSDDFERFYMVNDPNADPDGDGLNNLQEFQLGLNPLVIETLNLWTSPASGSWQNGNNWSTSIAPASNQTCLIFNSNSKVITVDDLTVQTAGATLTVSNLSVAAPAGNANTLQLSNMLAGGSQPLRVLGSLNITGGGGLWVSNSTLHVDGMFGGGLVLDGSLAMHSGSITVTGAPSSIGNLGTGQATISGGRWNARDVFVARQSGSRGTLTVAGTSLLLCTNLVLGTFDCGSTAIVAVASGALIVTNAATNGKLEVRSGTLAISGGLLKVDTIILTNVCAGFSRTGGSLVYGVAVLNPYDDTDADGLPNGWEQQFGLDPLDPAGNNGPTADRDGDGQTNLEEFLAGTDPTDPISSFRFLSIIVQGPDIRLRWLTAGDRTNALEIATGLGGTPGTNFTTLATFIIGGAGPVTNTFVDVDALLSSSKRYYRVRLVP